MRGLDRGAAARNVVVGGLLMLAWGLGTGLVVGLCLVQLLSALGLGIDARPETLLRRMLLP
jgi:hypothetical protein